MIRRSSFAFLSAALLLGSALDPARAGHVLVVGAGGTSFTEIQPAVDAAVDGDTILVKTGNYPGFTIDDKALSVVADAGATVGVVQSVVVNNLAASKTALVAGIHITGTFGQAALQAHDDAGALRVENCQILPRPTQSCSTPSSGAELFNDLDVSFCRCTITGGTGFGGSYQSGCPGGDAVLAYSSFVALYDCAVHGGDGGHGEDSGCTHCPLDGGPGGPGGSGYIFTALGFLFASNTSISGGDGGAGGAGCQGTCYCDVGGDGGAGGNGFVWVGGGGPFPWFAYLDSSISYGQGGPGGPAGDPYVGCDYTGMHGSHGTMIYSPTGSVTPLTGAARSFRAPSVVRENVPFTLRCQGQPGDQVWAYLAHQPLYRFNAPFHGVNLTSLPPAARLLLLGTVPSSGILTSQQILPDTGLDSTVFYWQAVFRDPTSHRFLSGPVTIIDLDSAY